ncbi:MAG: TRAP transporter small permease [Synergistetes bacterium]|nr:TRAP transporter small permease [Synergistota bacterium]
MNLFRLVRRVVDGSTKLFYYLSMAGVLFIAIAVFYNVIMRYLFRNPTYWSTEVTSVMLVILTFLGAGEILKQDHHIKFSLILDRLSPKGRRVFEIINSILGVLFCVILVWQGGRATEMVYTNNMRMPSLLGTPLSIPYFFITLGALTLALQFFFRIVDEFSVLGRR